MSLDLRSFPRYLGVCLFFFISTALTTSSCSATSSMSYKPADKVIEMTKGPCYGRCPVFTLTIYKNGLVSYKGERYTDRLGTYEKKLKKKELQRIIDEFKRANFWQFRDTYRGMIPDMQSVSITYAEDGKKKTVTGKEIRPNAVKWLEAQLDQLANSEEGWKLIEAPEESVPDYLIPNELIVELEEGADPEEWAKKYIQSDMLFEKQLVDSGYWIFSFDDGLILPEEMLEQVRQDEQVISAEFNKEIYNKLNEEKDKEKETDATTPTVDGKKKKKQQ